MKLALLVTISLLFGLGFSSFSISKFEGPPFSVKPPSGMYSLGGLGFDNVTIGNQVVAYGDFNNDKYTDIVTMGDDIRTLTIFIYSHDSFSFWPLVSFTVDKNIASVIPGDFDYDGQLDLLVITIDSTENPNSYLEYYFRVPDYPFFGPESGQPDTIYQIPGQSQPFILDTDGDRKSDLMFIDDGRKVQTITNGDIQPARDFEEFVSTARGCMEYSAVSNNAFAVPHSNAFVDFNGDCAADLFITSIDDENYLNFEIWLRNPSDSKFCLVDVTRVNTTGDTTISPVSFGDMNNDGKIDLVYATIPANPEYGMSLNIIYNQASTSASSPCGATNPPMTNPFISSAYSSGVSQTGVNTVTAMTTTAFNKSRLYSPDPINRPGKIRIGDINIDGYADLLYVVYDPTTNNAFGSIVLAINEGSNINFNQASANPEDSAYYLVLDDATYSTADDVPLTQLTVQYASFFDFDELGRLGIWFVNKNNTSSATTLGAVFNFVSSENFILKTLGLNGVKPVDEDDISTSLGGLYYGASIECTVTDIDGDASLSKAAQLPVSAYTPLDLPYMFIGLGRTNNYIENFVMGISLKNGADDVQQTMWTPIIPNSQLIVNPLIDETWTLDVYVNPTSETLLVVLTTLVILIILGGLIIYLHLKEKKEDKKLQDKMIHIFG